MPALDSKAASAALTAHALHADASRRCLSARSSLQLLAGFDPRQIYPRQRPLM